MQTELRVPRAHRSASQSWCRPSSSVLMLSEEAAGLEVALRGPQTPLRSSPLSFAGRATEV